MRQLFAFDPAKAATESADSSAGTAADRCHNHTLATGGHAVMPGGAQRWTQPRTCWERAGRTLRWNVSAASHPQCATRGGRDSSERDQAQLNSRRRSVGNSGEEASTTKDHEGFSSEGFLRVPSCPWWLRVLQSWNVVPAHGDWSVRATKRTQLPGFAPLQQTAYRTPACESAQPLPGLALAARLFQ